MALKPVSLDDKFDIGQGRIFVTGFQALVRLCLMQKERDLDGALLLLASGAGRFMAGATIVVDGGQMVGLRG